MCQKFSEIKWFVQGPPNKLAGRQDVAGGFCDWIFVSECGLPVMSITGNPSESPVVLYQQL